jgi:hypothetical protein
MSKYTLQFDFETKPALGENEYNSCDTQTTQEIALFTEHLRSKNGPKTIYLNTKMQQNSETPFDPSGSLRQNALLCIGMQG